MLSPIVLTGAGVRLEPLALAHAESLAEAAAEDRASYGFTRVPDGLVAMDRYIRDALKDQAQGRAVPFAVRRLPGERIVGSTRFLDLDVFDWPPSWPPGVSKGGEPSDERPPSVAEIGSTWYSAGVQRTAVNTEVKLLLLTHAFEVWGSLRVTFKTDARNLASRRAIERLGAHAEGVRRAHVVASDGTIRDSAYYSILLAEWPQVRKRLGGRTIRYQ